MNSTIPEWRRGARVGQKTYKIQIGLSPEAKQELFDLVEETDAPSATKVVRNALAVYSNLVREQAGGGELFLHHPDGSKTKLMLP